MPGNLVLISRQLLLILMLFQEHTGMPGSQANCEYSRCGGKRSSQSVFGVGSLLFTNVQMLKEITGVIVHKIYFKYSVY